MPAKKKRVGIDPFTKQERTFAAKPAAVKLKVRSLKKLKTLLCSGSGLRPSGCAVQGRSAGNSFEPWAGRPRL